jgi:hypothetical protein
MFLAVANTLAYYAAILITPVKAFIEEALGFVSMTNVLVAKDADESLAPALQYFFFLRP